MRRSILFLKAKEGEPVQVLVERRGSSCRIARPEHRDDLDAARLPDGRYSLIFEDGRQYCGRAVEKHGEVRVFHRGEASAVPMSRNRPAGGSLAGAGEEGGVEEIRALMPGRIVEVCVSPGERVEQGALLLVLEAMKMQNEIRASRAGVIERAQAQAGQTVDGGAFMLSIRSESI
jgi:biotin carboxyl carrier protein